MKICGQKMEITLTINGEELTFTENYLISVLEKHLQNKALEESRKIAMEVPTPGEKFEVKPLEIDQNLFQYERYDEIQEKTRLFILKAFKKLNSYPEKYGKTFEIMILNKTWEEMSAGKLMKLASVFGDHNANWVELALEFAQRICNGESWESICNKEDNSKWYRLIVWKNGEFKLAGNSGYEPFCYPYSDLTETCFTSDDSLENVVPYVVCYK